MSSAHVLPLPFGPFQDDEGRRPEQKPSPSRRRTSPEQGRALETLGHAIEYLVDSRLFDQWESPSDAEAVHLLMACSRSVFADCEEVCPWHQRVQRALLKRLHMQGGSAR
ncbi:MAG: hypothetical protein ACRYGF_14340 [Janthinobacterium lividum]